MSDTSQEIQRAITQSGYNALRTVRCRLDDGIVELQGDVPSFYLKQMAQYAVQCVRGVREIRNCLKVTKQGLKSRMDRWPSEL